MKSFNLSEYLENTLRKIVTRDGCPVRIICVNANIIEDGNIYPIVALVKKEDNIDQLASFTNNGVHIVGKEDDFDLFFKPIQKKGWTNIYRNSNNQIVIRDIVFETKEEALNKKSIHGYVDTILIKWEE